MRQSSYLLLILLLAVFAAAPLTYPGYMQVHSGFIPIYNLADLAGRPPDPRWTPGLAADFDPLRGDGLLPYYLALPFVYLAGAPLAGVKAVFALSFLLGAVGVYLWLRRPLGPAGAALAALVYTYLPYHLAAVYVRGALGEALWLGLLPWALAATTSGRPTQAPFRSLILTGLAWALSALSQAGLALWGFALLVAWLVWVDLRGGRPYDDHEAQGDHQGRPYRDQQDTGDHQGRPYLSVVATLAGLLVALILTFAVAGVELPPSPIAFFDHFLYPAQLFSAYWGYGASRPGWNDGMALGFGFAAVGLAVLALALGWGRRQAGAPVRATLVVALLLITLLLALSLATLPISAPLWRFTGLHVTLTYPWQLLGLAGLCLSALAGAAVSLDRRLATLPAYASLLVLTLLASYPYLEPRFTQQPPHSPLAAWDAHRVVLLDYGLSVEIPPSAAGLGEPTLGRLSLADYGSPRPGDTLHLVLTWQITRPFERDMKLFLHLHDPAGRLIAQTDPLAGAGQEGAAYFTSRWEPGELIRDDVSLPIPPDAPAGPYRLAFGLYDGDTGQRLPVVGREDGQVEVEVGDRDWRLEIGDETQSLESSPLDALERRP